MKGFAIILGVAAWGMFPMSGTPLSAVLEPRPDVAVIVFGADTVVAEVMDTPAERSGGLQFRDNVPDGTGMLFVFQSEAPRSFWMKDTYIALDIAYLDVSFRIVDIQQMEPQTEELHNSAGPAMFALEVRKGWFAEKGIGVGAQAKVVFDPPGVRITITPPKAGPPGPKPPRPPKPPPPDHGVLAQVELPIPHVVVPIGVIGGDIQLVEESIVGEAHQ